MRARTAAIGVAAGTVGVVLGALLSIAAQRVDSVPPRGPGSASEQEALMRSSASREQRAEPLSGHVPPGTFLAWVPGGMPAGFQRRAAALHGMRHAVVVANDTTWMSRSYAASGQLVDHPTAPYEVPLDTAAVAPGDFAPFLPRADRHVVEELAHGEGVLGASSARLRGLGPGAVMEFGSVRVRIAAVLPDELVGANELLVARDVGRLIGAVHDRYALLAPHPAPSASSLARELHEIAGSAPIQVRAPGDTPFLRQGDAVLAPIQIKERFGEFDARPAAGPAGFLDVDPAWVHAHISTRHVPLLGEISCNRALFPQLTGAMRELRRRGLGDLVQTQHGCYVPKFVMNVPTAGISHHAWGIAFDINLAGNEYGEPPHQPPRLLRVLERWGFVWAAPSSFPTAITSSTTVHPRRGSERGLPRSADGRPPDRRLYGLPAASYPRSVPPTFWNRMPEPHRRTARVLTLAAALAVAFAAAPQGVAHAYVRADVSAPTSLPPPITSPAPALGPVAVAPLSLLSAPQMGANVLFVWAARGLPADFSSTAERSTDIRTAALVTQDVVWMTRSFDAEGKTVDHPARPFAIPVDTEAVDPGELSQVADGLATSVVRALYDGRGILGASSAKLRGIGAGGALQFGGRRVRIAAVVPDGVLGHSELLVSSKEGAKLGVATRRYAIVQPDAGSSRARVAGELARSVRTETPLQIRTPRATRYPAQGDLTLSPVRLKEVFGEFDARPDPANPGRMRIDPRWLRRHIRYRTLPLVGNIECNRALFPQLLGAIHELQRRGLGDLIHTEDGCFVAKYVMDSPTAGISKHAWGAAVDLNIDGNRFGEMTHQDPRLLAIMRRWGFLWGGDFQTPDGNHFEFQRTPPRLTRG